MHLIQILLPLCDNDHHRFPPETFEQIRQELVAQYGGLTAYIRSPATGLWQDRPAHAVRDEIVIYEIMVARVDRIWWRVYREKLAGLFHQHELVVRSLGMELL